MIYQDLKQIDDSHRLYNSFKKFYSKSLDKESFYSTKDFIDTMNMYSYVPLSIQTIKQLNYVYQLRNNPKQWYNQVVYLKNNEIVFDDIETIKNIVIHQYRVENDDELKQHLEEYMNKNNMTYAALIYFNNDWLDNNTRNLIQDEIIETYTINDRLKLSNLIYENQIGLYEDVWIKGSIYDNIEFNIVDNESLKPIFIKWYYHFLKYENEPRLELEQFKQLSKMFNDIKKEEQHTLTR